MKDFIHTSHLNGFSPVCVIICHCKACFDARFALQISHWNGLDAISPPPSTAQIPVTWNNKQISLLRDKTVKICLHIHWNKNQQAELMPPTEINKWILFCPFTIIQAFWIQKNLPACLFRYFAIETFMKLWKIPYLYVVQILCLDSCSLTSGSPRTSASSNDNINS